MRPRAGERFPAARRRLPRAFVPLNRDSGSAPKLPAPGAPAVRSSSSPGPLGARRGGGERGGGGDEARASPPALPRGRLSAGGYRGGTVPCCRPRARACRGRGSAPSFLGPPLLLPHHPRRAPGGRGGAAAAAAAEGRRRRGAATARAAAVSAVPPLPVPPAARALRAPARPSSPAVASGGPSPRSVSDARRAVSGLGLCRAREPSLSFLRRAVEVGGR